ncbi:MAG: glycosyltransferase family 4 protein [Acidimicrobiales bacterium]
MRLGVNGWLLQGAPTGGRRYLSNLLVRWTSALVDGRFDGVTVYSPRPVDRSVFPLPDGVRERVVGPPARMLIWESARFGPVADDDVLFCPSYSRPLATRAATVVAIHDATSKMHPELYGRGQPLYNRLYGWSASRAELVLTSTDAARADIARCWGVEPSKIRVVPLAAADHFGVVSDREAVRRTTEQLLGWSQPYFLFVGKTSGRRRVPMLLEAFASFKERGGARHRLVLAGPRPTFELEEHVGRLGLAEEVTHSGVVSDEDLNALYNGADGVICPSVYETVSLPIMEAQACGSPVVCVDAPGSREITGGAAWFMPRLELDHLVEAMSRLAAGDSLGAELAAAGLENARRYSWSRTAAETLDVLAEAATLRSVARA